MGQGGKGVGVKMVVGLGKESKTEGQGIIDIAYPMKLFSPRYSNENIFTGIAQ